MLRWATINHARALRLDHRIGSLTPRKQVDLIILCCDNLGMIGACGPVQALAPFAQASDVPQAMVGDRAEAERLHPGLDANGAKLMAAGERLLTGTEGA